MECENCGGYMETMSISCGADPGRDYHCSTCGRMERHRVSVEVRGGTSWTAGRPAPSAGGI